MGVENFTEVGTKVVAIGFNYPTVAEGFIDIPEVPLIFLKSKSSYITEGQEIVIPPDCKEVIHEVELGVVIGKRAKNIKKEEVFDYVAGYCAVNDITDVAFLRTALKKGTHWILAKSCDTFCPVSKFVPKEKIKDPDNVEIYCLVNGEEKQRDNTAMVFTEAMTARLLELYQSRQNELNPSSRTANANQKLKDAWSSIAATLNMEFPQEVPKGGLTVTQIQTKFKNLKQRAKEDTQTQKKHRKMTGGGSAYEPSALTNKMQEIFNDSPSFHGVPGGVETGTTFGDIVFMETTEEDTNLQLQVNEPQPSSSLTTEHGWDKLVSNYAQLKPLAIPSAPKRRFDAFGGIGRLPQSNLSASSSRSSKATTSSKEDLADLQKQLLEMNLKEHEAKKEMHDLQMKFFDEGRLFFKEARERYEKKE